MRRVLVDLDGVVVDMLSAIKKFIPSFKPENVTSYSFDGDIGCDKKEVFDLMKSHEVFEAQGYYEGALEAMQSLKKYVKVVPYTLLPVNAYIAMARERQLRELGLPVSVYFGKKSSPAGYDAVFEDNYSQLIQFDDSTKLFMINHTYNMAEDCRGRIIRCENFPDAVKKYLGTIDI